MTQQQFTEQYSFDLRKDKIGGGSFGTVYKAYDNINDIEVAIKVSEVKFVGDKEFSLLEEYNAIKNLPAHANIANYNSVYRFESFQGIFDYALMQYYPLGNLSHYLKNNTVSQEDRKKLVMGILEGISFLHQNKVVHRDLKPSNILVVDRKGQLIPKITDFGLSKQASADAKGSRFTNSFAGGTLQYSSPEQIKGLPLKLNTDLWSFGAIAYEILTGKTLFETQSESTATAEWQKEITNMILHTDVSDKLKALQPNWQNAIAACLQRDLTKRVQSTEALQQFINSEVVFEAPKPEPQKPFSNDETEVRGSDANKPPKPPISRKEDSNPTQPQPKKNKWLLPVAASLGFILLSVGYFIINGKDDTQQDTPSLASFEENGLYGYKLGDSIVINPKYELAGQFKDNQALVKDADSTYYINNFGDWAATYQKSTNQADAEKQNWALAQQFNTIESYNTYKNKYPDGAYISEAQKAINNLNQQAKENQAEQQRLALEKEDREAYNKAKRSNIKTAYQDYLNTYPNGKYRNEAKNAITKINNEEDRLAKIEKDKKEENTRPTYVDPKLIPKNELESWINKGANLANTTSAANSDNAAAQRRMGRINGFVYKNDTEAVKWYLKAANNGDAIAQSNLGTKYENGEGVSKNYNEAVKWFRKAANQGDDFGQYNLGRMYYSGKGVTKDYNEALLWFKKAANQNHSGSQNYIGVMYDNGIGVNQDNYEAVKWYKKAANSGLAVAQSNLGLKYDNGQGTDLDWDEAVNWYKKAVAKGDVKAKRLLGEFYLFGVGGVSKDVSKAKQLFKEAANTGDKKAKQYLKVLADANSIKTSNLYQSRYNNKIYLSEEGKNDMANEYPYVMSKYGNGYGFNINYSVGESSYIGGMWPARTSDSDKKFEDEVQYTNYSSSSTYLTESGTQRASLSFKNSKGQGYRAIGYMYVRAFFKNPDETLILKIPYTICWKPKNEY